MKDFINWLGVNEKIAKLVVWIFSILVMLIIINAALDSLGFPHYQITYDNLKTIHLNIILDYFLSWLIVFLSFCAIAFLVFRVKNYKTICLFGLLYFILNLIITRIFNGAITQIFTVLYILGFCYFYSNRSIKYLLYGLIAFLINSLIQGITYFYKTKFIDYNSLEYFIKSILSIDYFVIMAIIILVKEIYLKKRSELSCGEDKVGYGGANSTKKGNSLKN